MKLPSLESESETSAIESTADKIHLNKTLRYGVNIDLDDRDSDAVEILDALKNNSAVKMVSIGDRDYSE